MNLVHGETVTVVRQVADRHGDAADGPSFTVPGCAFAPGRGAAGQRSSVEDGDFANRTVVTGATMYVLDPDVPIGSQDIVVRADGTRWQVQGEVARWRSPMTGWAAGAEITLERVTG